MKSPSTGYLSEDIPHVLIVGAGFGGLYAALALRKAPVQITIVDRRNHHLFQPLLYQVATSILNASDIASPIRNVVRNQKNAKVMLAEALSIDAANNTVVLREGNIEYDYLILATGSTHSYFGHNEWAENAQGLKTVQDALQIRRRILVAFETAESEAEEETKASWLTFVIVGAGPTGVELAGALADMARDICGDFRNVTPSEVRVILVEGENRVLPGFPDRLSAKALSKLRRMGVDVRLGVQVTDLNGQSATIGRETILVKTILWAAGVAASPLGRTLGSPVDKAGRVIVEKDLTIPGHRNVFVVGDLACIRIEGAPVPGVAQAAIQAGTLTAENIARDLDGLGHLPFRYHDKGTLAAIGRGSAVAIFAGVQYSGVAAWLLWLGVHIFFLIGFRNRILVLAEWAWAYVARDRGARLITDTALQVKQARDETKSDRRYRRKTDDERPSTDRGGNG